MQDIYKELKEIGYSSEQIYQLMFLYSFNISDYRVLINGIKPSISVEMLEQIVKCITHKIPYNIFLNTNISVEKTIEIRRFLEDSLENDYEKKDDYILLAKQMIEKNWIPNLIYEFRRFFKCKLYFDYHQIKTLFNIADNNQHWVVLACIYDITLATSNINNAFNFLELENIKQYIKEWKEGNEEALVCLMIETKRYLNSK